jgi:Dolichyl-phosphate-mannose-protein mannosyltransferase
VSLGTSEADSQGGYVVYSALLRFGKLAVCGFGLAWYTVFLATHVGAYAGGSDSSGYLGSARLFAAGRLFANPRVWSGLPDRPFSKWLFLPLGFRPTGDVPVDSNEAASAASSASAADNGAATASPNAVPAEIASSEMVPTYPIGMSLLVAATSKAVGWDTGSHLLIVLHALAGVLLQFWVGRCAGLSQGWAALGALLLACCPLYIQYSLQLMSDVPATAWGLATIALAWQARRHFAWSVPAGFAFALGVLIRPTNVLFALPALLALGSDWRRWAGFALGAAPGACAQLLHNRAVLGHFIASGYGNVERLFLWKHVPLSLANYREWLPVLLTPLGLLAILLPLTARTSRTWPQILGVWVLSFVGIYAFYYHTHESWWYLRFILPAFPAIWIAALLVAQDLAILCRVPKLLPAGSLQAWLVGGLAATAIIVYDCRWTDELHAATCAADERRYRDAIEWMRPKLPDSSLVMCMQVSGALYIYSDVDFARWDRLHPGDLRCFDEAAAGRSIFALVQSWEVEQAFCPSKLSGRWNEVGKLGNYSLWRLEPGSAK